jgi:TonB family protein
VIPVDEERVRTMAAEIERQAAPVIFGPVQPAEPIRPARYVATQELAAMRETRVRAPAAKLDNPVHGRQRNDAAEPAHETPVAPVPGPAKVATGEGSAVAAPVLAPGEGERAPVAQRPVTQPPAPPATGAAGLVKAGQVTLALAAAPAVISPLASTTAVRAQRSELALFIHQVERAVARNWFPSDVYTRVDPTGNISGAERRTAMRVRLRADGRLERLDVESSSGVPAMDEEARAAFTRAQPFARPPASALDAQGGLTFPFSVSLDLALARWKMEVKRLVRVEWQPRPRLYVDRDRTTIVRVLLTFEGVVSHASLETSSGNPFLDGSGLVALKPGLRLPKPPASLGEVAGLVPVRLAFLHRFRGAHEVLVLTDD